MEPVTAYTTISSFAEGIFKASGSQFLAYGFPASDEIFIKEQKEKLKKEHHKAVHVAFGARLGYAGALEKFTDDGEPSGTAGRPILNELKSRDLTEIVIFVVRYFGGKKLGVPGLIQAYRTAAADALDHATIITIHLKEVYTGTCNEKDMPAVMHMINRTGAQILDAAYGEICTFKIRFNAAQHTIIYPKLTAIWQMELQFLATE